MDLNTSLVKNFIIKKYPYFIIFLSSFVTFIWLHGGVLFFWDEVLPVFPYYDFTHLIFVWSPINLGVINLHADQFASYYLLWFIFSFITLHSLFLTEQLIIFFIFLVSGFSSFTMLNFIFSKFGHSEKQPFFALIGALFYMFNYFDAFLFFEIQWYWVSYSLLPLALYFILYGFTKLNSKAEIIKYSLISAILLEIIFSFTFNEQPVLIFISLIIIAFCFIFKNRIHLEISKQSYYYILFILFFSLLLNLWWYQGFFHLIKIAAAGSSTNGIISEVSNEFLNSGYKLKFWSVIALYPRLYPLLGNNDYQFVGLYTSYHSIFFFISILFFILILLPIINIKSKNSLLNSKEKVRIYILLFVLLFFGVQGANPLNRALFELLKIHLPILLPYLYTTSYYFIEIPIIIIYILLFPVAIFEIIHSRLEIKFKSYQHQTLRRKTISKRQKKIIAAIFVILIVGIFPYYFFTPEATMYYDDGSQNIQSVVNFPPSFYQLLDYIHSNTNDSTTLILPQSYDFFSVNFSSHNSFVDDEPPVFLTGSEDLIYQPLLTNQIDDFISDRVPSNSKFSLFLNEINVKYVVVDRNISSSIVGYGFITNTSEILSYINSRHNLTLVGSYGPLVLYRNINYNGLFASGKYSYFNPTISNPYGKVNVMLYMKNLSISNSAGNYKLYDNRLDLMAKNESKYNYSPFPINFQNIEPMGINISNYQYLIIKTGNISNSSLLYIYTKAFFINGNNGLIGNTILSPMNLSACSFASTCELVKGNTTYVLPLYQSGTAGYVVPINKSSINTDGTILNYIDLGLGRSMNLNSTYSFNITEMYFAKYISFNLNGYQEMSQNSQKMNIISDKQCHENQNETNPRIKFEEINPTDYKIKVFNASSPFALLFKQNYNTGWQLSYSNERTLSDHFEGDEYANAWIVNKTGNYTLNLVFTPQIETLKIDYMAIFINIFLFGNLVGITIFLKRKNK